MIDFKFSLHTLLSELQKTPVEALLALTSVLLAFAVVVLVWRGRK